MQFGLSLDDAERLAHFEDIEGEVESSWLCEAESITDTGGTTRDVGGDR